MADNWYKVSKFYRGGVNEFQIAVPAEVKLTKAEWDEVLEWLGDNTNGGRESGYSMSTRKLRSKSATLKVVAYPSRLCPKLFDYGKEVTTTRRMIGAN